jgi:thiamine pyrophosphate-dependent acetolactate synthase large subunit-like protein
MSAESALEHLRDRRRDHEIVISNQTSARLWPRLSDHPLDFNYNPSTMGGAVPFGVGLALAQPDREVIVLSGDGSLLMSLGCLVTTVACGATNMSILLLDNGIYEVTGGQKTAAADVEVDYAGMATAAGYNSVRNFETLSDWRSNCESFLAAAGPRFARLAVERTPRELFADPAQPLDERVRYFQQALRGNSGMIG